MHMVCDLTIAADNAIFGQTGPKVLPLAYFFNFVCYSEVESRVDTNPHMYRLSVCRLEVLMLVMEVQSCLVW